MLLKEALPWQSSYKSTTKVEFEKSETDTITFSKWKQIFDSKLSLTCSAEHVTLYLKNDFYKEYYVQLRNYFVSSRLIVSRDSYDKDKFRGHWAMNANEEIFISLAFSSIFHGGYIKELHFLSKGASPCNPSPCPSPSPSSSPSPSPGL